MANRKLQTEIDRVLKKVAEGVETFEGIFEKIQAATNSNQKEKLEQDLKKEIKKLQRHRDQIKTWISSNDIKDKRALTENRRLIELQMEKFKACEKEMKTKAYSKEGLQQSTKMDPKEKEKMETCEWVSNQIDALSTQIETAEAEVEQLQSVVKKSRKDSQKVERLGEVENMIERHKWHVNRLELILRLLENGNIPPEKVIQIKDDINYYIESNQEPDFAEDENIYDDLNLEEEEELWAGIANDDHHSSHDSVTDGGISYTEPRTPQKEARIDILCSIKSFDVTNIKNCAENSCPINKRKKKLLHRILMTAHGRFYYIDNSTTFELASRPKEEDKPKLPPPPISVPAPTPTTSVQVSTLPTPVSTLSNTATVNNLQSPQPTTSFPQAKAAPPVSGQTRTLAAVAKQAVSSVPQPPPTTTQPIPHSQLPTQSQPASDTKKDISHDFADISKQQSNDIQPNQTQLQTTLLQPILQQQVNPLSSQSQSQTREIASGTQAVTIQPIQPSSDTNPPEQNKQEGSSNQGSSSSESRIPAALADLVQSYEAAEEKFLGKEDGFHIQQMLDASLQYVPESLDSERPKYYAPRNPYPTSAFYPQNPPQIIDNPALFEKFDLDTLFFIFYYQQGTYQQYLAARELKKQSWRFHKKYLTWFQRHEEPKAITDEYEQGTYIYFDYEGAWCQRKKTEFRFEYRFLEDAELI
ncbi:Not1 N-terminal domain, CCR4-Not complex component-domain-containing protein [Glomus cerebriforme]|uniref:General negative regulator of transcription subunit n=1 Tax=Glomus cerebriforme TaxID=658196 RepID=A0A397SST6_9GLOM|nr:Not1 N-terminal domain, CCR4-Not complex component-domain-containing protein [Glomus cerebriforme]